MVGQPTDEVKNSKILIVFVFGHSDDQPSEFQRHDLKLTLVVSGTQGSGSMYTEWFQHIVMTITIISNTDHLHNDIHLQRNLY